MNYNLFACIIPEKINLLKTMLPYIRAYSTV
uniref:Uncharacterized protein n=1 Tax=Anguilla anguilla TaxID=7936 RepID=A0A0E9R5W6_ANGAN